MALYERSGALAVAVVFALVFGINGVVDSVLGLLGVEFARIAVGVAAVEVVNAVGDIAGLLNFSQKVTGADGVDATCRKEEKVAGVRVVASDNVHNGVFGNEFLIFFGSDLLAQSGVDGSTFFGIDDIPHFGLSVAVVASLGESVVGVYLHREVALGVDNLHQERECVAIFGINGITHEVALVFLDDLAQVQTLVVALGNHRFVAVDARDFPAFAYVVLIGYDAFVFGNLFAAPKH